MELLLYFLMNLTRAVVYGVEIAMLIRAVLSWMPISEENQLTLFIYTVTEPFIFPVRLILSRFEFVRNAPIDISFFATALILAFLVELL